MTYDESPAERTMSLDSAAATDEGAPQPPSQQDNAAIDALGPDHALLIVHHGPNLGARFLLDVDVTTVGRSVSSDIFLDDVTVSREHAQFIRDGHAFYVRDHGSLNGTYVNRENVSERRLEAGDEVQIGKYRLTFHPGAQA
ncbi:FHA domain-containing protein [Demequina iriomotensis]|uniref:FHA domain-containing protein n=1 Tax=Demequina iriomotensis TaxID=1536641 RepID=UPI00078128B2